MNTLHVYIHVHVVTFLFPLFHLLCDVIETLWFFEVWTKFFSTFRTELWTQR